MADDVGDAAARRVHQLHRLLVQLAGHGDVGEALRMGLGVRASEEAQYCIHVH